MLSLSAPLLALLALIGLAAPVPAVAPQTAGVTNADIPRDNQKGSNLNFERAQQQPFELSSDGTRLYTLNSPGARLAVFDVASGQHVLDVPIGIGAVSVARRPGTEELWVVDELASTVLVVHPATSNVMRSIRVGAQPHGIAFTPGGDRAYVTCSAAETVDVIDALTKMVVQSIPVPAKQPRGIVWTHGHAWIVPMISGNNSAPYGLPNDPDSIVGVRKIMGGPLNPLPDRDLLAIRTEADPAQDELDPALTRTGLGTVLFGATQRPGTSELWIPNTEALNTQFKGEKSFIEGQVVSNRISVVDLQGTGAPLIIDLDALAPPDQRLAQPTHVGFDASGTRAYVSGYGTDLVGVLDVLPGGGVSWAGSIALEAKQKYPQGAGPRATLIDPGGTRLYVYNRIDNALATVDLTSLPATVPFQVAAPKPVTLGFDPTSDEERQGRFLFANARFSKSMTSSCASCHVDGHLDGLAWDLSAYLDPEGTPPGQLSFPLDEKGPLVTQSTRRLQETGPYHWRGERTSLLEFADTFPDLLENQVNGQPGKIVGFGYVRHYMNNLGWPGNPRTPLDRDYTPEQLVGADLFMNKPVLGGLTCASCHQLPLGTSGEVVTEVVDGMLQSADIPALRGLSERISPPHTIGGEFGTRTELGVGFTHGGALATISDTVLRRAPSQPSGTLFDLTPQEADKIEAFLEAFDYGLAPAAGYMATAHSGNLGTFAATELAFLEDQAERGNCDLVYVRTPRVLPGGQGLIYLCGLYNPQTGRYTQASRWASELTQSGVLADVAKGRPVTFLGLPLGMGRSMGLDRDMDGLWDLDERRPGADFECFDTDGDHFPDGWEVQRGMDPVVPDTSAPDNQPPALVGPVTVHWITSNTLKFEFETTEMSRVLVSYNGNYPIQRLPLGPPNFATHHDVVLNELEPDTSYALELELRDPAGNFAIDTSVVLQTRPLVLGEPAYVDSISPGLQGGDLLTVVKLCSAGQPVGGGYDIEAAVYRAYLGGGLALVTSSVTGKTSPKGIARLRVSLPPPGPPSTLIFFLKVVSEPSGAAPHVPSLDLVSNAGLFY